MKGKITKVLTFFVVIGLIISMVIIKNATTIKVAKTNIEAQPEAAMTKLGHIDNFMTRFYTYDALIGNGTTSIWTFWDSNDKEDEVIKNIYCVQTGKSANNNTPYDIYDAYDLDQATINTFFGDNAHYHHFLYILENMFIVGRSGSDRKYMIDSTNAKLKAYNSGADYTGTFNSMTSEINGLDMAGSYGNTVDAKVSGSNNEYMQFNLWNSMTGKRTSSYTAQINRVDSFLAITQRYLLTSNVLQKDTNNYATNPVDSKYIWKYFKYDGSYTAKGSVPANTQKYADDLLKMLDKGFSDSSYDINKYKNFDENNTYISKNNAVYDNATNRVGPFTVVNPRGYDISVSYLKYGQANVNYSIVDADGNSVNLSSKTDSKEFYLQLNETFDNSNSLSVKFYIDFGDVPTARILIPVYNNGSINPNGQLMTTVDRVHKDKLVTWETKIEVKPDIALKKYIYAVNGSTSVVPARLDTIDLSPLANGTSTNANYLMNKTPLKVRAGDTVTYAIQLFNEGKVNATAAEIKDYLPTGLTFVRAYTDFDAVHTAGYDGSNDIPNSGTSNKTIELKNPNQNYITPYSNDDTQETFKAKSQIIYVDCKVGATGGNYVYTNMAEISEYKMEAGSDIDSEAANWIKPSDTRYSTEWQNYSNGHSEENPSWFDNGFHNWGAQDSNGAGDDDDFDKVIIEHVDLALTKRIEGKLVNGTEEMLVPADSTTDKSRVVISGYDDVKNGIENDLKYNMNKKPAHVQKEDQLVMVLTVYNEGKLDGVVKEITDYLPKYLIFNAEKTAELNSQNIEFTYVKNSGYLFIEINGNDGVTLQNLNDYDSDPNNHKVDHFEVKVVLDVSKAASERLYNSAAITEYGYNGADGVYYSARQSGLDKDSYGYVASRTRLVNMHIDNHTDAEDDGQDLTQYNKNNLQEEDDDDMDVVEVDYNPNFDLSLRKYIQKIEKDFDGDELVDETDPDSGYKKYSTVYERRIPVLDEFSLEALNETGTAEYYHEKLKVEAEKDDLVTYRIRVYNEGKGDDCFGRATEITDYLPDGLQYVSLENGNDSGWTVESTSGNKIVLKYAGDKKLPTDSIETLVNIGKAKEIKEKIDNGETITTEEHSIYNQYYNLDEHDYYQEIGVICKVTSNDDFKIITNRAAITDREAYKKVYRDETHYDLEYDANISDRDNDPNDELNPRLNNWYQNTVVNETTPDPYYPGEEDDDDFDSLYVYNYDFTIRKTDKTNDLPGATFKVIKYRVKSEPRRDYYSQYLVELATIKPQVELTDMETALNTTGEATHKTTAPASEVENDVYIIKEIQGPDGHYNPFEGKYIKVSMRGVQDEVHTNFSFMNMAHQYMEIYEDNGDDDYTNDTYVNNDFRDPYNVYK